MVAAGARCVRQTLLDLDILDAFRVISSEIFFLFREVALKFFASQTRHSLLLTDTGRLFAMGDNTWESSEALRFVSRHGQLGMESRTHGSFVDTPRDGCLVLSAF